MTSASAISLTDVSILTAGESWIEASTVTGLARTRVNADLSAAAGLLGTNLRNLTISGGTFDRGGQNAGICNVNGVTVTNLLGTSSVTGATFTRSNTIQFRVNNNTATNFAGAPDTLTVSGTTWNDHNVGGCFGDHLSVNSDTGGNFRLTVNSTAGINIVNPDGDANGGGIGVQATAGGTNGKMDADITGLKTSNNTAGVVVAATVSGTITYNIHDNNTDSPGTAERHGSLTSTSRRSKRSNRSTTRSRSATRISTGPSNGSEAAVPATRPLHPAAGGRNQPRVECRELRFACDRL